ncbi:MAG: glycerol acyltransferase [Salinivirgaceae bacterium]|nr:glycerol acyltransferase [Salinivirgaceae bacterium]
MATDCPQIDIEKIISSKNPKLLKFIPKFLMNKVKRTLHIDEINWFLRENQDAGPYEFVDAGLKMFGARIKVEGVENIPADAKRLIFISNHPLGGLDGLVFTSVVYHHFGEVFFPVNDLLLNLPNMKGVFLPINKHGRQSREGVEAIDSAYAGDRHVLYFPAGLCSRKIRGRITDLEWKRNFLTQAVKYQRDVVPVHITGENSKFFYNLANIRKKLHIKANLEMFFLIDEMYNQYDRDITITFGKPVGWQTFDKSRKPQEWVQMLRESSYLLESGQE